MKLEDLNWNHSNMRALAMRYAHHVQEGLKACEEFAVLLKHTAPHGTVIYQTGSHGGWTESRTIYRLDSDSMVACARDAGYVRKLTTEVDVPEGIPRDVATLLLPDYRPQQGDLFYEDSGGRFTFVTEADFHTIYSDREWFPAKRAAA